MDEAMRGQEAKRWAEAWIEAVASGASRMSQRRLSSLERLGGGIDAVRAVAERSGVHLLLLEDDEGNALVAASTTPFEVIC